MDSFILCHDKLWNILHTMPCPPHESSEEKIKSCINLYKVMYEHHKNTVTYNQLLLDHYTNLEDDGEVDSQAFLAKSMKERICRMIKYNNNKF